MILFYLTSKTLLDFVANRFVKCIKLSAAEKSWAHRQSQDRDCTERYRRVVKKIRNRKGNMGLKQNC